MLYMQTLPTAYHYNKLAFHQERHKVCILGWLYLLFLHGCVELRCFSLRRTHHKRQSRRRLQRDTTRHQLKRGKSCCSLSKWQSKRASIQSSKLFLPIKRGCTFFFSFDIVSFFRFAFCLVLQNRKRMTIYNGPDFDSQEVTITIYTHFLWSLPSPASVFLHSWKIKRNTTLQEQ